MEQEFEQCSDSELVAVIDAALSALADDRVRLAGPSERLQLVADAVRLDARLTAWRSALASRAESDEVALVQHGTSMVTWLADSVRMTRRTAGRLIADGERLLRFPIVAQAGATGTMLPEQVQAICGVLEALPDDFDAERLRQAEQLMVGSPTPTTPLSCGCCRGICWRCSTPTPPTPVKPPGWSVTYGPPGATDT